MMIYKFIKNDFKNNMLLYFCIVIELVIAISYISNFFLTIEYKEKANNIIEKSIGDNDTYAIGLHPEIILDPSSDEMKAFSRTLEYLYGKDEVEFYGVIQTGEFNKDSLNVDYNENINKPYFYTNSEYGSFGYFILDYDYYKSLDLEIVEGRAFNIDDEIADKDEKLIIMGDRFRPYYNIDDMIINKDIKYKIIGFAKEDTIVKYGNDYYNINNILDDSFIVLMDEEYKQTYSFVGLSYNNAITFGIKDGYNSDKFLEEITKKAEDYGVKVSFSSWKTTEIQFRNFINSSVNKVLFKCTIIAILAILALSVTLLYSVNNMKKEIGVLIVLGAKKKKLLSLISLKMFILFFISYLISFIITLNIKHVVNFYVANLTINVLINTILVILIIALLIAIIPFYSILKLDPIKLIGGFRE